MATRNRLAQFVPLAAGLGVAGLVWVGTQSQGLGDAAEPGGGALSEAATAWRAERRIIDLHMHIGEGEEQLRRAVKIMDAAGIGIGVNLSGGYVTPGDDGISAFQRNKERADAIFPGRFVHYMNLDYSGWDEPDFAERAVRQIEEGHRLGAAGLKEYKRLGLYLRDGSDQLIAIDDPKLDPVWKRCGELGMPVSIHVADPKAFWDPYDENNERWTELKDHRSWWFGDRQRYPERMRLLEALNRVIERHSETIFVCVHFANNAEDLAWVDRMLDRLPNMMADIAARVPEIGRHDPAAVRDVFVRHQDRILFATDFMVYDRLILGSGGSGPGPGDDDALTFYQKHWRWFETNDPGFEHMTPIQGEWTIDAIGLPDPVLRKVYFDNARKLLVRSLPLPAATGKRLPNGEHIAVDGRMEEEAWETAIPIRVESRIDSGETVVPSSAEARVLWTDADLLVAFRAGFGETGLNVFEGRVPEGAAERRGLWDRDVLEVFVAMGEDDPAVYFEYEVAPTGEKLDLRIAQPEFNLEWNGGFDAASSVDEATRQWTAEFRIPFRDLETARAPRAGDVLRINFYRHDSANRAFLGWSPTATRSAHIPARFGRLLLAD